MYKNLTKYIYDLFLTSKKNECVDLFVNAMPMMMYDARSGERKYTDEQTDLAALHADSAALDEHNRDLRIFIARHDSALFKAFKLGDRKAFDEVVAKCIKKDEAKKEASARTDEQVSEA